jgi:hypothetical protein
MEKDKQTTYTCENIKKQLVPEEQHFLQIHGYHYEGGDIVGAGTLSVSK